MTFSQISDDEWETLFEFKNPTAKDLVEFFGRFASQTPVLVEYDGSESPITYIKFRKEMGDILL